MERIPTTMCIMKKRMENENGFTLIELLVVMIVIGILAAIALPIFLNQQKTARDTSVVSDVKNIATSVKSGQVRFPDAIYFALDDNDDDLPPATTASIVDYDVNKDHRMNLYVGMNNSSASEYERYLVSVSADTHIRLFPGSESGSFVIVGWNPKGKLYTGESTAPTSIAAAESAGTYVIYDTSKGGMQDG